MLISFTKMHGLGNDFVLLDERHGSYRLDAAQYARIADRRFGVGCDQILVLGKSSLVGTLGNYRTFNADGSAAEHCGNGVRCVARYLLDSGEVDGDRLSLEINGASYGLFFELSGTIRVDMGRPNFAPPDIPIAALQRQCSYDVSGPDDFVKFGCVSVGNPHAVMIVDDVSTAAVASVGEAMQQHKFFPSKVNVGFMQIVDSRRVKLRVFERGVGETLACGTGACAAVAVGRVWRRLEESVEVELQGGILSIDWSGLEADSIWMTGPAERVFEGTIEA
jgi:diaminopimelate epimerase